MVVVPSGRFFRVLSYSKLLRGNLGRLQRWSIMAGTPRQSFLGQWLSVWAGVLPRTPPQGQNHLHGDTESPALPGCGAGFSRGWVTPGVVVRAPHWVDAQHVFAF